MEILRGSRRIEYRNPLLPLHWDDGIKAGVALCGTQYFVAAMVGDSIGQGQYANFSDPVAVDYDYRAMGFWQPFMAGIRARYATQGMVDGGEMFNPLTCSKLVVPNYQTAQYVGGGATGLEPFSSPTASNVSKVVTNQGFWRLVQFTRVSNAEELLRFNVPSGTIKCDVVHGSMLNTAQTWYAQWGGVATTWGQLVNVGGANNGEPILTNVYTGAASQGPLYLGNQSVSSAMNVYGVTAYKDTVHGLLSANMSYGGRTFAEACQVNSSFKPINKPQALWDFGDGYNGPPRHPNLVVIEAFTNDNNRNVLGNSFGPAEYKAGLYSYIKAIRHWSPNASIIIVVPWHSQDYDETGNFVNNSSVSAYISGAKDVALARDCAVLDFSELFGIAPVANHYLKADAHPDRAGYALMASALVGILP